jgi:hypothetical protein
MEADWSVELAADDPVIAVPWATVKTPEELRGASSRVARFIDLRESPQALGEILDEIEEARERPALRATLAALNRAGSMLWTSKCDAWENGPRNGEDGIDSGIDAGIHAKIDPWEMDAAREEAIFTAGCYIDLLLRDSQARGSFEMQERWIRNLSKKLRNIPLRCARTDLVLRRAEIDGVPGFGVTWFVESCGANLDAAKRGWAEALGSAMVILMDERWLYREPASSAASWPKIP